MRKWTLGLLFATLFVMAPTTLAGEQGASTSLWSQLWGWITDVVAIDAKVDKAGGPLIIPIGQDSDTPDDAALAEEPEEEAGGPLIIPIG